MIQKCFQQCSNPIRDFSFWSPFSCFVSTLPAHILKLFWSTFGCTWPTHHMECMALGWSAPVCQIWAKVSQSNTACQPKVDRISFFAIGATFTIYPVGHVQVHICFGAYLAHSLPIYLPSPHFVSTPSDTKNTNDCFTGTLWARPLLYNKTYFSPMLLTEHHQENYFQVYIFIL